MVRFKTTCAISPIITKVVSSIPAQAIQHYLMKFVSDLRQVGGFLRFPPPIELTTTIRLFNRLTQKTM
jgi:hypothetical protein